MNPKVAQKSNARDAGSDPDYHRPAAPTLFDPKETAEGRMATPPPSDASESISVYASSPVSATPQVGPVAPEAVENPFDLGSIIQAKQEQADHRSDVDPFNLDLLQVSQDFGASIGIRRVITTIPMRKPSKETYVRTRPEKEYRIATTVLELKDDREFYLVAPSLREDLASENTFGIRLLVASITRDGHLFIWPIRLPGPDGKLDEWNRSALEAADMARTEWVRVSANMGIQAYDVTIATGLKKEPAWPDLDFSRMLQIAFKGKYIDSMDHPVLRKLRGEI